MGIELNQIVGRRSYNCDLVFRVIDIREEFGKKIAILYGEDIRLIADAPFEDLVALDSRSKEKILAPYQELEQQSYKLFRQEIVMLKEKREYEATGGYSTEQQYFHIPGKVLHIDGDPAYLKKCLQLYEKIGVPVVGIHCEESEMPNRVSYYTDKYQPDILVITGHDSYSKSKGKKSDLNAYRHSKHYVKTVKEVRKINPNRDQLIIFAGACQSHFESLIQAGANFASSPWRVNIHALDPVYIVAKISFTPFTERIHVWDILRNTLTGEKGIGGIETKGLLRTGMPFNPSLDEE